MFKTLKLAEHAWTCSERFKTMLPGGDPLFLKSGVSAWQISVNFPQVDCSAGHRARAAIGSASAWAAGGPGPESSPSLGRSRALSCFFLILRSLSDTK